MEATDNNQGEIMETAASKIATEIRRMSSAIESSLTARRQHPTYGITKSAMRRSVAQMEGMLYAHYLMTGGTSVYIGTAVVDHATRLGVNLLSLSERINNA
jgi:hypothetical protein